ncbi:type II toxin-antitoxin system VapC family toxin [Enemella sp. A6]|uniref:type II toxin-antitoxin system VapC family toxin n=1 Tax=Enemella sp. A6 TaxID=3440152 RepID=UPI003EBFE036
MILVDTSVWIDHLHAGDPHLVDALGADEVGSHALVIEELALGSIRDRATVLQLLGNLNRFPMLSHDEFMTLTEQRTLWGRGLSTVDVHLLGAVAITPGARLWTRDKRLRQACLDCGVSLLAER